MSVRKTISDSKAIFHKEFPFVIPSVYRRVVDEYLVELNLLSNQSSFKIDGIFSYGFTSSFTTFTQGYTPDEHRNLIFTSLCKSCNMDLSMIQSYEKVIRSLSENQTIDQIINKIDLKSTETFNGININDLIRKDNYYSRMHAIGIYELSRKNLTKDNGEKENEDKYCNIASKIGFNNHRVTKDITQYKNNQKRIKEAMELIKVTAEESKKRASQKI